MSATKLSNDISAIAAGHGPYTIPIRRAPICRLPSLTADAWSGPQGDPPTNSVSCHIDALSVTDQTDKPSTKTKPTMLQTKANKPRVECRCHQIQTIRTEATNSNGLLNHTPVMNGPCAPCVQVPNVPRRCSKIANGMSNAAIRDILVSPGSLISNYCLIRLKICSTEIQNLVIARAVRKAHERGLAD